MTAADDSFELYDLKVEVVAPEGGAIYCGARPGDFFELKGEMLSLPPGQGFSVYSLAALLPLLPAKQRETHQNDWMSTDGEVACPDPNCSTRFRITRTGKRIFRHAETTATPLATGKPADAEHAQPPHGEVLREAEPRTTHRRLSSAFWSILRGSTLARLAPQDEGGGRATVSHRSSV